MEDSRKRDGGGTKGRLRISRKSGVKFTVEEAVHRVWGVRERVDRRVGLKC